MTLHDSPDCLVRMCNEALKFQLFHEIPSKKGDYAFLLSETGILCKPRSD